MKIYTCTALIEEAHYCDCSFCDEDRIEVDDLTNHIVARDLDDARNKMMIYVESQGYRDPKYKIEVGNQPLELADHLWVAEGDGWRTSARYATDGFLLFHKPEVELRFVAPRDIDEEIVNKFFDPLRALVAKGEANALSLDGEYLLDPETSTKAQVPRDYAAYFRRASIKCYRPMPVNVELDKEPIILEREGELIGVAMPIHQGEERVWVPYA